MQKLTDPAVMPDVEVVARTLWGEARGQGAEGMHAVACVIRNRMDHPRWWGGPDAKSVCLARYQFSCWNADDPNRAKLLAVAGNDPAFRDALALAADLLADDLEDTTNGADHYCTKAVATKTKWAKGKTPVAKHGDHLFYRLELPSSGMKPLRKSRTVQAGAGGIAAAGGVLAALPEVTRQVQQARDLTDQVRGMLPDAPVLAVVVGILVLTVGYMLWRRYLDKKAHT